MTIRLLNLGRDMKRRRALILLIFFLLAGSVAGLGSVRRPYGEVVGQSPVLPPTSVAEGRAVKFRIAAFNIHSGRGVEGKLDLSRTGAEITGVDLAGLNEVRGPWPLGGGDQAAQLGGQLGMAAVFGPSERRWFVTSFGNGLLSRFPVLAWRSRPMRAGRQGTYRAVILARVKIGQQAIEIIVAHPERGELRDAQLRELRDLFGSATGPAILMGDLNAEGSHPELQQIGNLPGVVNALLSGPGASSKLIDHIYVKGLRVRGAGATSTQASDHPIVWADLEGPAAARADFSPSAAPGQRASF